MLSFILYLMTVPAGFISQAIREEYWANQPQDTRTSFVREALSTTFIFFLSYLYQLIVLGILLQATEAGVAAFLGIILGTFALLRKPAASPPPTTGTDTLFLDDVRNDWRRWLRPPGIYTAAIVYMLLFMLATGLLMDYVKPGTLIPYFGSENWKTTTDSVMGGLGSPWYPVWLGISLLSIVLGRIRGVSARQKRSAL
ncbi:MAG: hypothetical protein WCO52_05330 [bacterium]